MGNNRWSYYWQVLSSSKLGILGLFLLGFFLVIAVFAPFLAPFDPMDRVGVPFTKPNGKFLLGTNDIGQDILSEILYGSRVSLLIGIIAALISISLGVIIGVVSGYYGGKVDSFLMRVVDLVLVIPFLPLMILLAAFVGPSFWNIILVISLISWASPARVIRSQVLNLKTKGYVEAAKSIGTKMSTIMYKHITPGIIPIALSQFVMAASNAILIEASLSFLGLGDPFTKSWGTILYYAQARGAFLTDAWLWWILPPGLLITMLIIGFAFTGYSLEEILNPRLRKGR